MKGIIILLFSLVGAIEIIDLTDHSYVLYQSKECILANGEVTLIHHVNITQVRQTIEQYEHVIMAYENVIMANVRKSPFNIELQDKLNKLNDLFLQIYTPPRTTGGRVKRWEVIGTVWKWISGSPDAADLRVINETTNQIIAEENKQIIINRQFQTRLDELGPEVNEISKATDMIHIYLKLSHSLEYFEHELEHITQAISFAKQDIIYTDIFSRSELLKLEARSNLTISEIIYHGTVKIISNNEDMLFIYKLPTEIKRVTLYEILPVKPILKEYRLIDSQGTLWNDCSPTDKYECNQFDKSPTCIADELPIENIYKPTLIVIRKLTNVTTIHGNFTLYPPKIVKITEDITVENQSYIDVKSSYEFKAIRTNINTTYKIFTNMTDEVVRNRIDYLQLSTENLHFSFHVFSISLTTIIFIIIITLVVLRIKFRVTKNKTVVQMQDFNHELEDLKGTKECQENSTV